MWTSKPAAAPTAAGGGGAGAVAVSGAATAACLPAGLSNGLATVVFAADDPPASEPESPTDPQLDAPVPPRPIPDGEAGVMAAAALME